MACTGLKTRCCRLEKYLHCSEKIIAFLLIKVSNTGMEITKAQRELMELVVRRDAMKARGEGCGAMYRLSGRGMVGTVTKLEKLGLVVFTEHWNNFCMKFSYEVYLTIAGKNFLNESKG